MTKYLGDNPKDRIGLKKVNLHLVPDAALLHGAMALTDGAYKYDPYNWRENAVKASIYITAARRHLMAYGAGEETAGDSKVHHLGHVIACCAILLDAELTGNLVDDRAKCPQLLVLMEELNTLSKARADQEAAKAAD